MKTRALLPAIAVVALLTLAAASQAQAFELLNRMGGHGCGCEPTCAAPVCEPSCCAPAPVCGCEPACDPCCGPKRKGLLHGLFSRLNSRSCGCEPACGCEPTCAAPVCEPSCCAPAPVCGCEPACDPCCGSKRPGLLHGLFSRLHAPSCGCEPACGYEPACGCEPVCGM